MNLHNKFQIFLSNPKNNHFNIQKTSTIHYEYKTKSLTSAVH